MTLYDVFLMDGTLRPIWRCFLSLVLVFVAHLAANLAAGGFRALCRGSRRSTRSTSFSSS